MRTTLPFVALNATICDGPEPAVPECDGIDTYARWPRTATPSGYPGGGTCARTRVSPTGRPPAAAKVGIEAKNATARAETRARFIGSLQRSRTWRRSVGGTGGRLARPSDRTAVIPLSTPWRRVRWRRRVSIHVAAIVEAAGIDHGGWTWFPQPFAVAERAPSDSSAGQSD